MAEYRARWAAGVKACAPCEFVGTRFMSAKGCETHVGSRGDAQYSSFVCVTDRHAQASPNTYGVSINDLGCIFAGVMPVY